MSRRTMIHSLCCVGLFALAIALPVHGAERSTTELGQRVQAHLDAGEFGPALELAQGVADEEARGQLIQQVVDAQIASGEFGAARRTAGRLPNAESRVRARGETQRQSELNGSGTGADFTQLIDLIMNLTGGPPDGPWQEVDGEGGTIGEYETGVRVDPHGQLYRLTKQEQTGRLLALGLHSRKAALNEDMAKSSHLRLVSLTRLEKEVAKRVANGEPVLETMRHLAGLSQIQYIMVYPTEKEIVIAGPAEGWQYNQNGLAVGVSSGRPTLQLDDLVVVLRTFAPSGQKIFGCSINPRQEGLKAVKEFVDASQASGPLAPGKLGGWLKDIEQKMGLQDIEIYGIPANTRAGRVIVEADYRMKLIGIGKLDGGKDIPSIFNLLPLTEQKNPPPLDALRWWLTMKYDAVLHSPDRNVFEIQGSSVLVQSEDQIVTADGGRIQTGKASVTNHLFAKNFTDHYAELAKEDLVFADLQNIFDLGMVAAVSHHEGLADKIGWDLGVFGPQGAYRPAHVDAPETVHSVLNHRVYRGRDIVVQVAGGVRVDLMSVLNNSEKIKEAESLKEVGYRGQAPNLPAGRWWWDAAE